MRERRAFLADALTEWSDPPWSMELRAPRASVHARFSQASVGALVVGIGEISGCVTRYAPALGPITRVGSVDAAAADSYHLFQVLRGTNVIVQDGRHAAFRSGDFGVLDNSRAWTSTVDHTYRGLSCVFPRNRLGHSRDQVARLTAKVIPGHQGIGATIGSYLERLVQQAERGNLASVSDRIDQVTLDLIACLLDGHVRAEVLSRCARRELLERIHAHIAASLGDPKLSPERVARSHYISRSYLDKLFKSEGTTVSRLIRELRLERVRQQLSDPACVHESIAAIGARWGMPNPAHLSRLFRDANACSPREYRVRMLPMHSRSHAHGTR
jgi:AraC-like DNA-binding protein